VDIEELIGDIFRLGQEQASQTELIYSKTIQRSDRIFSELGNLKTAITTHVRCVEKECEELRAKLAAMESQAEVWFRIVNPEHPAPCLIRSHKGSGTVGPFYEKPVPADRPRITKQDAREMGLSLLSYAKNDNPWWVDDWIDSDEFRALLNKLNADREQVPAVAVPDYEKIIRDLAQEFKDAWPDDNGKYAWLIGYSDEFKTAPSHSQRGADAHYKNSQRYLWIKENIQEEPTQGSLSDSEYAEHKTCYKLPLLIAWADFCGHMSLDDAIDNQISRGDRCPSHESEQSPAPDIEGE